MADKEILDAANTIAASAIGTVVLQSGDDPGFSAQRLCSLVSRIKHRYPGMAVTLSVGERPRADYRAFRQAGADRYLLKHETANHKLYEFLHPGQTLEARIAILQYLRGIGFEIGAGMIVGLPGQTFEDLADDIMLMKSLNVDMAGIGPFIPQQDTPLGDWPAGSLELTLKAIALARIALPKANLPATTAVATLDIHRGLRKALGCGANVIMCNFTPPIFRKHYRIYDNKEKVSLETARKFIRAIKRTFI
jgi:biotin synthase